MARSGGHLHADGNSALTVGTGQAAASLSFNSTSHIAATAYAEEAKAMSTANTPVTEPLKSGHVTANGLNYDVFLSPNLAPTVLPFLNGESGG